MFVVLGLRSKIGFFRVGVFIWRGSGPVVWGLLGFLDWGSLYKHKKINLGKKWCVRHIEQSIFFCILLYSVLIWTVKCKDRVQCHNSGINCMITMLAISEFISKCHSYYSHVFFCNLEINYLLR